MLQIKVQNSSNKELLESLRNYKAQGYKVLDDALNLGKEAIAIEEFNHLLHILKELNIYRILAKIKEPDEQQQYLYNRAVKYLGGIEKVETIERMRAAKHTDKNLDTIFFTGKVTDRLDYPDWKRIDYCYNIDLLATVCEMYQIHIEWINCQKN